MTPACEDPEIRHALLRLRRVCFQKVGLGSGGCWCIKAAPDGSNIPCNEAMTPLAIDEIGRD